MSSGFPVETFRRFRFCTSRALSLENVRFDQNIVNAVARVVRALTHEDGRRATASVPEAVADDRPGAPAHDLDVIVVMADRSAALT